MSWLSKGLKKIERGISSLIPHEHSAQKRAREYQMNELKEQNKAYETQTKELKDEKQVIDFDKREQQKRAVSAFKRLRSGGTGLSAGEMSISNKLG